MQLDHTEIRDQLRAAFPAKRIQSEGAFRDWGTTYLDAQPYMKQIEGKTWEELNRAYLLIRCDALGFLGTSHLVAVLPVYLRSLVEEGGRSHAAETVLLLLTKPGPEKKTGIKLPRFEALIGALTPAQCAVIAVVLREFAAMGEGGSPGRRAEAALAAHWKTYLPAGS